MWCYFIELQQRYAECEIGVAVTITSPRGTEAVVTDVRWASPAIAVAMVLAFRAVRRRHREQLQQLQRRCDGGDAVGRD